jgi:Fic family protein
VPFEPQVDAAQLAPLVEALEGARQDLEALDVPPMLARWLRELAEARGAHMSTRIEGNPLSEQEVRELLARPPTRPGEAALENLNYRDAVRFAYQVADDAAADVDGGLLRAMHFLVVREVDRYGTAGQYRTTQNAVLNPRREVVYMPPHDTQLRPLMDDLVQWTRAARGQLHPLVLAAIAHAEFINIHPFDDGNGRTGRALTSYLLARSGWRLRGFVRAEQVFGADTEAYYAELRRFGPRYPGQRVDFRAWVRWFLTTLLREVFVDSALITAWPAIIRDIALQAGLSARAADGLGYTMLARVASSGEYAYALRVSGATAVTDLNRLVALGLVDRQGRGRATRYSSLVPFDDLVADARNQARGLLATPLPPTAP